MVTLIDAIAADLETDAAGFGVDAAGFGGDLVGFGAVAATAIWGGRDW